MASHGEAKPTGVKSVGSAASGSGRKPEWAEGLKRLYDSVVEEPLPDDLAALLSRLDKEDRA